MVEELLKYYAENARDLPWRHDPTPYRVWISEIMLQQTRVEAVKEYYLRFMAAFPDVETLAAAPEEAVLKYWEGLGYYSRARNLHKAAKLIAERGSFPASLPEILALPGIGAYTGGAIASIAFHLPEPAVDGNVLRVLARVKGKNFTRDEAAALLRQCYPPGKESDFTQSLMELGALVCIPNGEPKCLLCPVRKECIALRDGRIGELPAPAVKKPRRIEKLTVLLLRTPDGKIVLRRRPESGLLAGLWEFPNLPECSAKELKKRLAAWGMSGKRISAAGTAKHVFTHVEWHMKIVCIELENTPPPEPGRVLATPQELHRNYAVPSAFKAVIQKI